MVIEGEGAVNIIQQKSATAPIVEVRDRNDLPIGGATVTFAISGKGAAFANGARSVAIATDAAGRATASALTPLGQGAVKIQVAASFQGQSATAIVTQTNVATAAQAAQAAASSANAASTAKDAAVGQAGGGATKAAILLGVTGAAVGGGVVAAREMLGGSNVGPCSYSGPRTFRVGAAGGDYELPFTAAPPDCSWEGSPTTTATFLTVTGSIVVADGLEAGKAFDTATVFITVQRNPSGGAERSATLTWANHTFTVIQDAAP